MPRQPQHLHYSAFLFSNAGAYDKDATGFNSCQFGKLDDRWERFYGALPTSSFDRSKDCGRCVRVRGTESDAPTNAWYKVRELRVSQSLLIVAASSPVTTSSRCHRLLTNLALSAAVKVMIVDSCASCNGRGEENDIDFSTDALKAITGYSWDRKGIEVRMVLVLDRVLPCTDSLACVPSHSCHPPNPCLCAAVGLDQLRWG
jgi:hypothetical protein